MTGILKYLTAMLCAGGVACGLCCAAERGEYVISGRCPEGIADGTLLYLIENGNNGHARDSVKTVAGSYCFHGECDSVAEAWIGWREKIVGGTRTNYFARLLVEPGETEIVDGMPAENSSGLNGGYATMCRRIDAFMSRKRKEFAAVMADSTLTDKKRSINEIHSSINNDSTMQAYLIHLVKENPDNALGLTALKMYSSSFSTPEDWPEMYVILSPWMRCQDYVVQHNSHFDAARRTSVGCRFVDFKGLNLEGKAVSLSDFVGRGKYVLMDVWAPWCGPCAQEAAEILIPLHDSLRDDHRFMILGVNVNTDDSPQSCRKTVEKRRYSWPQICCIEENVYKLYGFNSIPQIMLFAPDGTLVARDLRGEELVKTVTRCLSR